MIKTWEERGWDDYQYWIANDKKMLKRVNQLIKDVERNGNEGIGKPEPLKHEWQGYWSRHIDGEHRLVYRIDGGSIYIAACRFHYE
ncbi:MAG: Txe/YoeB family addiction module toxin [Oscillospiraceae bacterium]|nr:Txe/YoeB family addiction module toxin [Oscillospiraceae bacterium]